LGYPIIPGCSVGDDWSVSEWFQRFGYAAVADGLVTGAYPLDARDVAALSAAGVEVAYNLCQDVEYAEGQREVVRQALARAGIVERRQQVEDYGNLSGAALDRAVGDVVAELEAGRRVYLHCRAGWQRSATVAAAVIALRENLSLPLALAALRRRKPRAEPLPHQRDDLMRWWQARQN
jgi:protein-tyrosine phosphatase